jgi:hypothetical protein
LLELASARVRAALTPSVSICGWHKLRLGTKPLIMLSCSQINVIRRSSWNRSLAMWIPASSWQWHCRRGQAISHRGEILPAFTRQRTSCCYGRDRKRFVTTLGEACTKWISAESHMGTGTYAAGQVAKLRTEPEVQNEFRLEQNNQD